MPPAHAWRISPASSPARARSPAGRSQLSRRVPLIGFAQAGGDGFFDDGGYPVGGGWDEVSLPEIADPNAYALEISGDSMEPVFRDGDRVIVSPAAPIRRGDRVVVRTVAGEVMAKQLARRSARRDRTAEPQPGPSRLHLRPARDRLDAPDRLGQPVEAGHAGTPRSGSPAKPHTAPRMLMTTLREGALLPATECVDMPASGARPTPYPCHGADRVNSARNGFL